MGVPDWLGDLPTWIGAGGAIGAAWYAFQTIKSQREQIGEQQTFIAEQMQFMDDQRQNLLLERAELQAQAEDRRVAQARQIKMTYWPQGSSGTDRYGNGTGYSGWHVEIANKSDDPIHNVIVRFGDTYDAASAKENEGFHHPDGGRRPIPVPQIPAGHTVVFESPSWSEPTVENNRPAVVFTDDAGTRWRRDSYAKLDEVPPGTTP
ncbi:hypothetical protein OOK44_28030 [Streptomyces cellulosae]|uniref:hypothetical protein n=1 Tax=Streptomyces TaxID=1883 RepID=UPI002252FFF0|nr:hypothetical protein [Streptomyces sp. OS603R]MCX4480260.1 hypothetical protein [Streptomyces cellulosae]WTC55053.1 hypothetical protein OH715_07085 [Streptomyces cellulosae]